MIGNLTMKAIAPAEIRTLVRPVKPVISMHHMIPLSKIVTCIASLFVNYAIRLEQTRDQLTNTIFTIASQCKGSST